MIEVAPKLWLHPGPPSDELFASLQKDKDWAILSAAVAPWFRKSTAFKLHQYVKFDEPGRRMYLALVDSADGYEFDPEIMDYAIGFIQHQRAWQRNVLVHCNMGLSRSPSIVMLYMASEGLLPAEFELAVAAFTEIYPYYEPGPDITAYVKSLWGDYVQSE